MAYTDSDFSGDINDRKSTSGFVFFLRFGAVSRPSEKQMVTLSTTKAEYIDVVSCVCQCIWIWIKRIMETLDFKNQNNIMTLCVNNFVIQLSKIQFFKE